jgi:hypothetical protein
MDNDTDALTGASPSAPPIGRWHPSTKAFRFLGLAFMCILSFGRNDLLSLQLSNQK